MPPPTPCVPAAPDTHIQFPWAPQGNSASRAAHSAHRRDGPRSAARSMAPAWIPAAPAAPLRPSLPEARRARGQLPRTKFSVALLLPADSIKRRPEARGAPGGLPSLAGSRARRRRKGLGALLPRPAGDVREMRELPSHSKVRSCCRCSSASIAPGLSSPRPSTPPPPAARGA